MSAPPPTSQALPRITQPHSVPVVAVDSHLHPVPPERLSAQALRLHFARPELPGPELAGDGGRFQPERAHKAAAVLVPLVQRPHGLQVLLTRRTEHLRDHAGQISFPGGRCEPQDTDAVATALRETHEEVGILPAEVEVLGRLPDYHTVTSYVVTPIVGLLLPGHRLVPDPSEVAEAFEVPLQFLMSPAHHRRHAFEFDGHQRQFLSMPWTGPDGQGQRREYFIWGATAAMLRNLYRSLADA